MPRAKPPKPPEPAKGKAAKVPASAPEGPATSARSNPLPEWAMQAYTAHVGRGQPINALAREFGLDWSTVKRNIEKVHLAVCAAENSDTVDARAKHEARLREVLKCLWQEYTRGDNQATRAQLLKSIADVSEKLAACQGVVTRRAAHEVTGKDGGPVQATSRLTLDAAQSLAVVEFLQATAQTSTEGDTEAGDDSATG